MDDRDELGSAGRIAHGLTAERLCSRHRPRTSIGRNVDGEDGALDRHTARRLAAVGAASLPRDLECRAGDGAATSGHDDHRRHNCRDRGGNPFRLRAPGERMGKQARRLLLFQTIAAWISTLGSGEQSR